MRLRRAATVAIVAVLAVLVPGPGSRAGTQAKGPSPHPDVPERVLRELNIERVAHGVPRLRVTDALRLAAEQRARDILALPPARRMNREQRLGSFLQARGIKGYALARERLFMLGGYDDPAAQVMTEWRGYPDAWNNAMAPAAAEIGIGWAESADGYGVFLAILVDPLQKIEPDTVTAMEHRAEELVNAERMRRGLAALTVVPRLEDVARDHSRDMAIRHYFDHVDPDGGHVVERVERAGFSYRELAENIAENKGLDDPVATAVQGWMQSPGHRANILNPRLRQTGIGIAVDEEGTLFFTQVFFTPQDDD